MSAPNCPGLLVKYSPTTAISLSPATPLTITLIDGGTVIHAVPNSPLAPNTGYYYSLGGNVTGVNGLPPNSGYLSNYFATGTSTVTTAPQITAVSPPNGVTNVGDNARISVLFNGIIDPLSANSTTIQVTGAGAIQVPCNFSFIINSSGSGVQDVILTPQTALPDSTQMTIAISGVTDLAGNVVAPLTTQFTTAAGPILVNPTGFDANPFNGATNVPLNAVFSIQAGAPIDPTTVNSSTLYINNGQVAGVPSVSTNAQVIFLVPAAPLLPNTSYSVSGSGIADVQGNPLSWASVNFTTGTTSDTVGPSVVGVSPANGSTVPTNTQIVIQFNKPIDAAALGGITLTGGTAPVVMTSNFLNSQAFGTQQMVEFTPTATLNPQTAYTLTIAGVADLAGIPIVAPDVVTFTTSAGADLTLPLVQTLTPANGATGVLTTAAIQITYSKPIDLLSVNSATISVQTAGTPVQGTATVSANGQTVIFTPNTALTPSTTYSVSVSSVLDLVGNSTGTTSFSFTTGSQ